MPMRLSSSSSGLATRARSTIIRRRSKSPSLMVLDLQHVINRRTKIPYNSQQLRFWNKGSSRPGGSACVKNPLDKPMAGRRT